MRHIDGSFGEGGGQILRTALGLSLLTQQPFEIENIRSKRSRPGVLAQHLAAIYAATMVGHAQASGDTIGSQRLVFTPHGLFPGIYVFSVGTAGSTSLVMQTILPALMHADGSSVITLEGGTHNPGAPSFHFLEHAFLRILTAMNAKVRIRLITPGFYPAGGGKVEVTVHPQRFKPIDIVEKGKLIRIRAMALVSKLHLDIGSRELNVLKKRLKDWPVALDLIEVKDSPGPGNAVFVEVEYEHVTEVFTGFGKKGVLAEHVARELSDEVEAYLGADAPIGEYLADQLLIPFALAGGGSFVTSKISSHTETNMNVIQRFLDIKVNVESYGPNYRIHFT